MREEAAERPEGRLLAGRGGKGETGEVLACGTHCSQRAEPTGCAYILDLRYERG